MKALDKKLLRELNNLRGQIITIGLVVISGIAAYIAMQTTYLSLHYSKDSYYEAYRFPDIFAKTKKAPNSLAEQIRNIDGVSLVYTRTVESVRIPLPNKDKVFNGQIISLPSNGRPLLNDVFLRKGRMPDANRSDEALILEGFAKVHNIRLGDEIPLIINNAMRTVTITGLAISPEYVFAIGGDILSYEPGSFAVIWMPENAVNPAFNMVGAFNDITLNLQPQASKKGIIMTLDELLAKYGGFGAQSSDKQISNHFFTAELEGLKIQAITIPIIFLTVAAFLVNVVLNRIVQIQRGQIATLKALGYSNLNVGMHFIKLVLIIVFMGSFIGIGLGSWLGTAMLSLYEPYFNLPEFKSQFDLSTVSVAVLISFISAVSGASFAVRKIIKMPPADAMRPPSPPTYKASFLDKITKHALGAIGRMVVRELTRHPIRIAISALGIAMAVAILVIGRFAFDSMDYMLDLQYGKAIKENLTVNFMRPLESNVKGYLKNLAGVNQIEGIRSVPVRIRSGPIIRDTVIQAMPDNSLLRSLINRDGKVVEMPLGGAILTDVLANLLEVKAGDIVEIEILEGNRAKKKLLITGSVTDMLGMQGYMNYDTMQALLGETASINTAMLNVEAEFLQETQKRLQDMPAVAGVMRPDTVRENFEKQQAGTILVMTMVLTVFASIIAVGIVYNNARVSLSMRARDLASMRILGFTKGEIFSVLLGELSIQVLLAIPIGLWLGIMATNALLSMDPENYRLPAVISSKTYIFPIGVTILASLASALLVRRKLNKLDLIEVLKTRE